MRRLFASVGQVAKPSHRYNLTRPLLVPGLQSVGYLKIMIMKLLSGGVSMGDTTRNKQTITNHFHCGRFSVWHLFDSNVQTVERFSWLIFKAVLDRYRQVVLLTLFSFSVSFFLQVLYQHTANQTNRALLVWKTVGSNAAHNITKAVMLFTHSHYLMHSNLNPLI